MQKENSNAALNIHNVFAKISVLLGQESEPKCRRATAQAHSAKRMPVCILAQAQRPFCRFSCALHPSPLSSKRPLRSGISALFFVVFCSPCLSTRGVIFSRVCSDIAAGIFRYADLFFRRPWGSARLRIDVFFVIPRCTKRT